MSFHSNLGGIRAWGRKLVLPVARIKELVRIGLLDKYQIDRVIDFGAGTLYWSEWFEKNLGSEHIYPVDVIFRDNVPDTSMRCYSSIDEIPAAKDGDNALFFTCDVLHHLSVEEWERIGKIAMKTCRFIVIKDINCHYKFKNWMNRTHDRIINGERIRDVDPEVLMEELRGSGYQCMYQDLHKLWYPHFIIIAVREGN